MWKAIIGLLVGILLGILVCSPSYAGKKKKPDRIEDGVLRDTNRDGVVEFYVPLYRPTRWVHVSCSDGFTHNVFSQIVEGPIGLPWMYMRWEVDPHKTHRERMRMFGPNYRIDPDYFPSVPQSLMDENRW
jgi:hypothetical protein